MSTEISDAVERVLQDVGVAATQDFDALKAALEAHGISIKSMSNSLLKILFRNVQEKKCNRCGFVGEDLSHLKKHLKEEDHYYGQENLVIEKKKFIERVKDRREDATLPQVHFPINSTARQQLTKEEAAAFNGFAKDANLTKAEETTYGNLLYTSLNSIIMRNSVDAPSPATRNAAVKGLAKVLASSSAVAATPNANTGEDLANAFEELAV